MVCMISVENSKVTLVVICYLGIPWTSLTIGKFSQDARVRNLVLLKIIKECPKDRELMIQEKLEEATSMEIEIVTFEQRESILFMLDKSMLPKQWNFKASQSNALKSADKRLFFFFLRKVHVIIFHQH